MCFRPGPGRIRLHKQRNGEGHRDSGDRRGRDSLHLSLQELPHPVCVLLRDKLQAGQLPVYTGMDRVRFHRPVRPGEIVETQCRIKRSMASFYCAEGTVSVDGWLCAAGSFSFALTEA